MREKGLSKIQPTAEAEEEWRAHVEEVGKMGLFAETESWYFGGMAQHFFLHKASLTVPLLDNIPGKPKEALNYMGGMQAYKQRLKESEENDYKGFEYE